jgi:hypothetical protein
MTRRSTVFSGGQRKRPGRGLVGVLSSMHGTRLKTTPSSEEVSWAGVLVGWGWAERTGTLSLFFLIPSFSFSFIFWVQFNYLNSNLSRRI